MQYLSTEFAFAARRFPFAACSFSLALLSVAGCGETTLEPSPSDGQPAASVEEHSDVPDAAAAAPPPQRDAGTQVDASTVAPATDFLLSTEIGVPGPYIATIGSDSDVNIAGGFIFVSSSRSNVAPGQRGNRYALVARRTSGGTIRLLGGGIDMTTSLGMRGSVLTFGGNGSIGAAEPEAGLYQLRLDTLALSKMITPKMHQSATALLPGAPGDDVYFVPFDVFNPFGFSNPPPLVGHLTPGLGPATQVGGIFHGGAYPYEQPAPRLFAARGRDFVYCDRTERTVVQIGASTGATSTLATDVDCASLAVGPAGDVLIRNGGTRGCPSSLLRISPSDAVSTLATKLDCAAGIALDQRYAYATVKNTSRPERTVGEVLRFPLDGSGPAAKLVTGETLIGDLALDPDTASLYFATAYGIRKRSL